MRRKIFLAITTLILIGAGCTGGSVPAPSQPTTSPPAAPPAPSASPVAQPSRRPAPSTATVATPCLLTPDLVKKHCTVSSELQTSTAPFAKCVIQIKRGTRVPLPLIGLFERPWLDNQRVLATTNVSTPSGTTVTLPSWDVSGVGDIAWVNAFYNPTVTYGGLEASDGFNLYIKKGATTHQFVSYGRKSTGTSDICTVNQTKELAKEMLGE